MVQETNIFLVRHGETEWNRQQRLQGHQNSPLTANGVKQAKEVRKALETYSLDFAYVSPLQRARDTIEIVLADRGIDPVVSEHLSELNLGPWEGKTRKEAALSHPVQYSAFLERPHFFNLQGTETFQTLQRRMAKQLDSIFVEQEGYNVLVVSHWIAIKVVLAHYLTISLSRLSEIADPQNGGFYRLSKRGETVIIQ